MHNPDGADPEWMEDESTEPERASKLGTKIVTATTVKDKVTICCFRVSQWRGKQMKAALPFDLMSCDAGKTGQTFC